MYTFEQEHFFWVRRIPQEGLSCEITAIGTPSPKGRKEMREQNALQFSLCITCFYITFTSSRKSSSRVPIGLSLVRLVKRKLVELIPYP